MTTAKQYREKRANIWDRQQEILNTAAKEGRALSAEEDTNFAAAEVEMKGLLDMAQKLERAEQTNAEMRASTGRLAETLTDTKDKRSAEQIVELRQSAFNKYIRQGANAEYTDDERAIMQEALRAGSRSMASGKEVRAMSENTDAAGGYLVPAEFQKRILQAQLAFGGVRNSRATVINTADGRDIQVPANDDTTNTGARIGENVAVSNATDLSFALKTLKAWKYTSNLILCPRELIEDSVFDVQGYIAAALGTRIARVTNTDFTTGDGAAGPEGVATFATSGVAGATGQSTSVIYNDLLGLEHSIDPSLRQNGCQWMFRDSTLLVLKKLKDGEGRPLWQAGMNVGTPDSISGYSYVINQDVPAMAASAKSILFGDFSQFWIRDVAGSVRRVLDERYAEYDQVGFILFERHDSKLMNPALTANTASHPIKYYANSAT